MSSEDDFNMARFAISKLGLHRADTGDKGKVGRPSLDYADKQVLEAMSGNGWMRRGDIADATDLKGEALKKRLKAMVSNGYVESRKDPNDGRYKTYRRI